MVRALVLLITLAFVPAFGEVVETVVHAVEYGDAIHGRADHADGRDHHGATPLGADEHGCSPLLHLCGCHTPAPATTATARLAPPGGHSGSTAVASPPPLARAGVGDLAPPTRPPIA